MTLHDLGGILGIIVVVALFVAFVVSAFLGARATARTPLESITDDIGQILAEGDPFLTRARQSGGMTWPWSRAPYGSVARSGPAPRSGSAARSAPVTRPGPASPSRPRRTARPGTSSPPGASGRPGPAARARRRPRAEVLELLPDDGTVSLGAERRAAGIEGIFDELDRDLIGLTPVKAKLQEIASLLLVDRGRRRFGLTASRPNLHMCFTGPPGTGKTTVALKMAELLHQLGYLEQGHVVHAMRDDLVGEFIGQTAPRTKRVLNRAMGGVLFIDEAYYLYRADDSRDYGQEAIEILLQVMENERDRLVVILAGYADRMAEFFTSNPGMSSRIAHHVDFAAYRTGELVDIGRLMLRQSSYYLSAGAEGAFRDFLVQEMDQPGFANARSVRNALELARLRHAHRLAAEPDREWNRDDLMRLEPPDILALPASLTSAAPARP